MTSARPARTVAIDCFPESAGRYVGAFTVVGVDVLRATTTAITALHRGRRCYPVATIEQAVPVAARLDRPLLVGELGGNVPYGFDADNSPSELDRRTDVDRPMILLSTSGTRLLVEAQKADAVYAACLRNWSATVRRLAEKHPHVAVVGAGARGEFREEDQLCCAWIAGGLVDLGYEPWEEQTAEILERWRDAPVDAFDGNRSTAFLRATAKDEDLAFVLSHVDDVDAAYVLLDGELVEAG